MTLNIELQNLYFKSDWYKLYNDNFMTFSPVIVFTNLPTFVGLLSDKSIELVTSVFRHISRSSSLLLKTPCLSIVNGKVVNSSLVNKALKFEISENLYDKMDFSEKSWYENVAEPHLFKSVLSLKSNNLIFDDQGGGAHNELVIIPVENKGYFIPKVVMYKTLNINYITFVNLYITNSNDKPITFENSQFTIVLHFK